MSAPSKYYHDQLQGYPAVDHDPSGQESTDAKSKPQKSNQGSTLTLVLAMLAIAISMLSVGFNLGGIAARSTSDPVIDQLQSELRSRPVIYVERQVKAAQPVPTVAPKPMPMPTPPANRPTAKAPTSFPEMTPPPVPYQTIPPTPPIPTVPPNAVNEGCVDPDTGDGC